MAISQIILLLTGLTLSGVAAYYSVTGLAYIFAGAFWPVVLMGGALEVGKVVGASWVYRSWRTAPKVLSGYVAAGVLVLMLLTGVGIFGYLSRAYMTQQAPIAALAATVDQATRDEALAKEAYTLDIDAITNARSGQSQTVIDRLAANDRLTGANGAVRVLRDQQAVISELQERVAVSSDRLRAAQETLSAVTRQRDEASIDVGPLMFAAKAWYGDSGTATMDRVVTWFIILILVAFDPMAIALILAAQSSPKESPEASSKAFDPSPFPWMDKSDATWRTREVAPWTPELHTQATSAHTKWTPPANARPQTPSEGSTGFYEPSVNEHRTVHEPVNIIDVTDREADPVVDITDDNVDEAVNLVTDFSVSDEEFIKRYNKLQPPKRSRTARKQ